MAADREPGGICSDASEALTSPRPPNFAAESLIAAPLPQTKDSGADSLDCGVKAAIGEHYTILGICVRVAVPGRIGASAPYLPIGVPVY